MAKDKVKICRENGEEAEAQSPVIVSASRATDTIVKHRNNKDKGQRVF